MSRLGTDITTHPDLDFTLRTGQRNLAEAIARRLETPNRRLFYDPVYGTTLRTWLNTPLTPSGRGEIAQAIQVEALKDPRVTAADVDIEEVNTGAILVRTALTTTDGTFPLILRVEDGLVEVLNA